VNQDPRTERFRGFFVLPWRVPVRLLILTASWYAMMIVHELGHVLAAWATGSTLSGVVVPWVGLSQTVIPVYRHPTWVVGTGPIVGVLVPIAAWGAGRSLGASRAWLEVLRFFAGFCLVANGAYMASAFLSPAGDTEDLLALSVPVWAFGAPGLLALAAGLWVWNGLGKARDALRSSSSPGLTRAAVWFAGVIAATMLGLMFARP
jgi:hypothetical protein